MARAWRTCHDACRDRSCSSGENVPGALGACATRNFACLVWCPWYILTCVTVCMYEGQHSKRLWISYSFFKNELFAWYVAHLVVHTSSQFFICFMFLMFSNNTNVMLHTHTHRGTAKFTPALHVTSSTWVTVVCLCQWSQNQAFLL